MALAIRSTVPSRFRSARGSERARSRAPNRIESAARGGSPRVKAGIRSGLGGEGANRGAARRKRSQDRVREVDVDHALNAVGTFSRVGLLGRWTDGRGAGRSSMNGGGRWVGTRPRGSECEAKRVQPASLRDPSSSHPSEEFRAGKFSRREVNRPALNQTERYRTERYQTGPARPAQNGPAQNRPSRGANRGSTRS